MVPVLRQVGAPTGEADSWEKRLDKNSDEVQGLCRQFPDTLTSTAGWNGSPTSSLEPLSRPRRTPACRSTSWPTWRSACIRPAPTCGGNPELFRQGRYGRRAAGLLQPAGADRASRHSTRSSWRTPATSRIVTWCRACSPMCRRGAHRPHPRPVPPVVDPLRAHAQGRRLCAVRFRDHARHPGT